MCPGSNPNYRWQHCFSSSHLYLSSQSGFIKMNHFNKKKQKLNCWFSLFSILRQFKTDCLLNHVVTEEETQLDFRLVRASPGSQGNERMRSLFSTQSDRNHVSLNPPWRAEKISYLLNLSVWITAQDKVFSVLVSTGTRNLFGKECQMARPDQGNCVDLYRKSHLRKSQ